MKVILSVVVVVLLAGPLLVADQRHVVADDTLDFSTLKTFSIREGRAATTRPELNNPLMFKRIAQAIRAQLITKNLTETSDRADVVVGFALGSDRPYGPSVRFDRGTLIIEMTRRDGTSTIWQGVYTDDDVTPAMFAERAPGYVRTLLTQYPPKRKK